MKKFLINIRYLLAPLFILAAVAGVYAGGPFVWTGVALLGLGIVVDTLVKTKTPGAGFDENGDTNGVPLFQNAVMYTMLPVFVLLQAVLAWRIWQYTGGAVDALTTSQLIGATMSSGIFLGIGIIYGHELAHTKGFSFIIARWMMALSAKAHFCYAHVYNHHLELAHEDDPATAPRGRSLWAHFPKSGLGQSKFLFLMEKSRLNRLNLPFLTWQNRWLRGYAMALPTIGLFWFAGGWIGMACLFGMWMISNFELETLNYLEHYGLIREKGQPIDYRHSWDTNSAFTSWFFIEIGRQGDHHDRGETHFWELDEVGAPNTGHGYFTLFAIALFPPLWRKFIEPYLEDIDKHDSTEGEQKIAREMNKVAGYQTI